MDNYRSVETARRNDEARKSGLGVKVTCGAAMLPDLEGMMQRVRDYNCFTEYNDPYGAHDMGCFDWTGKKVIWKIDYWNGRLTCFEDPVSETCKRIITVMLAREY